jgi:hypothetical protein
VLNPQRSATRGYLGCILTGALFYCAGLLHKLFSQMSILDDCFMAVVGKYPPNLFLCGKQSMRDD